MNPKPTLSKEVAETIVRIAQEQAALVAQLKQALERADDREALRLARLVAGIEDKEPVQ